MDSGLEYRYNCGDNSSLPSICKIAKLKQVHSRGWHVARLVSIAKGLGLTTPEEIELYNNILKERLKLEGYDESSSATNELPLKLTNRLAWFQEMCKRGVEEQVQRKAALVQREAALLAEAQALLETDAAERAALAKVKMTIVPIVEPVGENDEGVLADISRHGAGSTKCVSPGNPTADEDGEELSYQVPLPGPDSPEVVQCRELELAEISAILPTLKTAAQQVDKRKRRSTTIPARFYCDSNAPHMQGLDSPVFMDLPRRIKGVSIGIGSFDVGKSTIVESPSMHTDSTAKNVTVEAIKAATLADVALSPIRTDYILGIQSNVTRATSTIVATAATTANAALSPITTDYIIEIQDSPPLPQEEESPSSEEEDASLMVAADNADAPVESLNVSRMSKLRRETYFADYPTYVLFHEITDRQRKIFTKVLNQYNHSRLYVEVLVQPGTEFPRSTVRHDFAVDNSKLEVKVIGEGMFSLVIDDGSRRRSACVLLSPGTSYTLRNLNTFVITVGFKMVPALPTSL